jgi:hypothetical protein
MDWKGRIVSYLRHWRQRICCQPEVEMAMAAFHVYVILLFVRIRTATRPYFVHSYTVYKGVLKELPES